ncbi:MAG: hypothetical protein WCS37_22885, partial [Chloroflexota bacterium]
METIWLMNPLQNPLAGPVVLMLTLVFGGGGVALLGRDLVRQSVLVGGGSLSRLPTSGQVLWQRYRTWAIIALLFGGAALTGPLALAGLGAFLCWQGGREYATLANLPKFHSYLLILCGWLTLLCGLVAGSLALLWTPTLAFFIAATLSLRPVENETEPGLRFNLMLAALWGYLYLGWLPAHLVALSTGKDPGLVLAVGLGVALSD